MAHTTFIKCPEAALKWSYRGPLLVQEILRSGADLLCLEEVDHYKDFFEPELARHGFEGVFFPKCDSPCLYFPDNNGPDGCALFYRSDTFELSKKKELVLKNINGGDSHQVALLAEFKMKHSQTDEAASCTLVVAMAHLKAKTEGEELRVAQGRHLIEEASAFSGTNKPVIIAGDFNAPTEEDVYKYFSNTDAHPDLKLDSSYKVSQYDGKEPPFTSWKFRAKGEAKYTIDYIWYTPDSLCVEGVWGVPEETAIGEGALPCSLYPSDHIALCSWFSFKQISLPCF